MFPGVRQDTGILSLVLDWLLGVVLVYGMLFGVGKLLLGEYGSAGVFLVIVAATGFILYSHLSRVGWEKVVE